MKLEKCSDCSKLNIKMNSKFTQCKICSKIVDGTISEWNKENKKES